MILSVHPIRSSGHQVISRKEVPVSALFQPRHGSELLLFGIGGAALAVLALAALHRTPARFKRRLTVACTFLAGSYYVLEFFLPAGFGRPRDPTGNFLSPLSLPIGDALLVIGAFTFGLGIFNLAHIHWTAIRRQRPGWYNSLVFFIGFAAMATVGFWHDQPGAAPWVGRMYQLLFRGLWQNLGSTMFSLLAFFIASAAYRAFRIRSGEALVLMITAMILMLGQVPVGMALTSWIPEHGHLRFFGTPYSLFRIENFSRWVLMRVNNPVQRAIDFGIGLGALAMGVRIWLSIERGTYFGE
jgi:hypothetical protein